MSGVIGAVAGALVPGLFANPSTIRPGSFRGVPFVVDTAAGEGGRRIVTHQFPLRDRPFTEDLGRHAQQYRLRVFVIGDDYMDQRDALLSACQDWDGPGILIHPYLGERRCRAGRVRWTESRELGGYAAFEIEFVEDGPQPSPLSVTDTAGGLLSKLLKLLPLIKRAYAIISLAMRHPGYLLGFAENILGSMVGAVLGLPAGTIMGLYSTVASITASAGNDGAVADGVLNVFSGAADNVALSLAAPDPEGDPMAGGLPTFPPGSDLTGGLAALAGWGAGLPAVGSGTAVLANMAAQQAAIVELVRSAATASVLQVYAAIDWPSADAATAALAQVLDLVDARSQAAADLGLDDLYRGWQAIGAAAVQDLGQRAQQLPRLARYGVPGSLPALALAQLLYQNGARADELIALNAVSHPAFMPRSGYRLG
jgi:DNA circularisation protein N-terminus